MSNIYIYISVFVCKKKEKKNGLEINRKVHSYWFSTKPVGVFTSSRFSFSLIRCGYSTEITLCKSNRKKKKLFSYFFYASGVFLFRANGWIITGVLFTCNLFFFLAFIIVIYSMVLQLSLHNDFLSSSFENILHENNRRIKLSTLKFCSIHNRKRKYFNSVS
jgi:hypothetical protein